MKKIVAIILFVVLAILVIFMVINKSNLPNDFAIKLTTDSTSSGGDRLATADLRYSNSFLVEGIATYIAHPTTGGEINYSCSYENGKWVNTRNTTSINLITGNQDSEFLNSYIQSCQYMSQYPITVAEVKSQIKNKKILPAGISCTHNTTCYTLSR